MADTSNDLVQRTYAITSSQLQNHVQSTANRNCDCGSNKAVLAIDGEGRPEILMMPTARRPEIGSWFFWTFCDSCGNTTFYSAYKMLSILEGAADVRG